MQRRKIPAYPPTLDCMLNRVEGSQASGLSISSSLRPRSPHGPGADPEPVGQRLAFVSDLHLTSSVEPLRLRYDEAFVELLDVLRQDSAGTRLPWRLVVLGDLLDFPETPSSGSCWTLTSRCSGEAEALERLEAILAAHPLVVQALRDHLTAGLPLDLVRGNHDVDLAWPRVEQRLREALTGDLPPGRAGELRLHPWIFHVPGLVYAEHGHQHHATNSFSTVLEPWRGRRLGIEQVLGDAVGELRRRLEEVSGATGTPHGTPRGAGAGLRSAPSRLLRAVWATASFAPTVARELRRMADMPGRRRRPGYRDQVLERYASSVGLPQATLHALDELSVHPPHQTLVRLRRRLARASRRTLLRSRCVGPTGAQRGSETWTARDLHTQLSASGVAVPFYLFGHTHAPAQEPLHEGQDTPQYLNTGCWSPDRRHRGEDGLRPTWVAVTTGSEGPAAWLFPNGELSPRQALDVLSRQAQPTRR